MNVCEHLAGTAKVFPDSIAIVFDGQELSYLELDRRSVAASCWLHSCGVERGDRVALMLPNAPSFAVWYFAAARIGAVVVSISTRSADTEVAFVLSDCQPQVLVVAQANVSRFQSMDNPVTLVAVDDWGQVGDDSWSPDQALAPYEEFGSESWCQCDPDDPAAILYTSGTTGYPKGATLSHRNIRSNVCAFNHLCEMRSSDRMLLAVPLFHCFGQNALLNSVLNAGATIVLQRQFDLNEAKQLIVRHQVTQLYGVPMMFQLLLDHCSRYDLASVRYCFSAAATLPVQLSQAWEDRFAMPIHEGYGLTETSPFASYNHRLKFVRGSIGMPIDSVEMKIVDRENGRACQCGELGEIAIRGPNVMLGYWNRPAETAAAIRDGWFYSGDIGRVDEDGYYFIVDRVKDMITVGGLKVFPAEVERVLLDHKAVSQAAVVGFPDPVFGEQVVAFVVLKETDQTQNSGRSRDVGEICESIRATAANHLASYKVPRKLIEITQLPRNPSGKILKTKLREFELDGSHDDDQHSKLRHQLASTFPSDRRRLVQEYMRKLVQDLTDSDEQPELSSRFLDVGLDSLMIVELANRLRADIGSDVELPATLIFDYPQLDQFADFLVELLAEKSVNTKTTENRGAPPDATSASSEDLVREVRSLSDQQARDELLRELSD